MNKPFRLDNLIAGSQNIDVGSTLLATVRYLYISHIGMSATNFSSIRFCQAVYEMVLLLIYDPHLFYFTYLFFP